MTNKWAIEAKQLHKKFTKPQGWRVWQPTAELTVVDDVSLQVAQGECFGLLGINGAGKTTLTKMLATLIVPTGGTAVINGYRLTAGAEIRASVGLVVTDERSFYWRLTALQNLRFFAALHGLHGQAAEQRIAQVLADVALEDVADRPFRFFSSGMKQRLAIARALLHRPRLLFLDEPSRSLDPTATIQLHKLVQRLNHEGLTIFLITHDLIEAEILCQRLAIMHEGRVHAAGTPAALRQQVQAQTTYHLSLSQRPTVWGDDLPVQQMTANENLPSITFQADPTGGSLTAVLDHLRQEEIVIHNIISEQPSLATVFTKLTEAA